MYQIDNPTAAATQPAPTSPGTAGYFTDGSVGGGVTPTIVPAEWLNAVMLELKNAVIQSGQTLSKSTFNQLAQAIQILPPGRLLNVQVFTASGTYTPTPGTNSLVVEVLGGGGAGGGAVATAAGQGSIGGGGWSGAYAKGRITSGFSGAAITVGAGGAAVSGANGNTGGTSSFGALISAPGGPGGASSLATSTFPVCQGASSASMSPATGGSILNSPGNPPNIGIIPNLNTCAAGAGASSPYGSGGYGITYGVTSKPGTGYGAAGGGAANSASAAAASGGAGSPGLVIVWEYA